MDPYLARHDRQALCSLSEDLGPDAPTLCAGWTTGDLAAHLVARDTRPDSVPGLVLPALAGWSERVRRHELHRPYAALLKVLRSGPPWWSPLRVPAADRMGNTHEFFVHYEDVRRAQPDWGRRALDADAENDLWRVLGWFAGRAFRRAPVGIVLRRSDGEVHRAGGRGEAVSLSGPPGELLLYAFGRRDHAQVEFEGSPELIDRLRATPLSW